ncbi:MAG: alpha/beta hydrolase [Hamadaea sp.]|uniref:alpha/beta fold hydrolase n=1 Tax=Hamadaea sp. TaxID=2024425 RepID=UPI0017D98AFF|nr:alpha/beta hydrolase [Hamadaea sp.]NUR69672.1 alpha/beta hydrolase [Hamadaea sp.]NUT19539.1 alpha/beta hydrolase [Hamadaea sp.]
MDTLADAEGRIAVACGVSPVAYAVEIPDVSLRARVLECGSGPAIVLLPDLGMAASTWLPLMAELDGHRVIAVDLPGFGQAGPMDYRTVSDLREFAVAYVHGLLSVLGLDTVTLAGNGVGGLWALWTAADRAERVRTVALLGAPACTAGTSVSKLRRVGWQGHLWPRLGHPTVPGGWAELAHAVQAQPGYTTAFRTLARAVAASGGFGATDLGRLAQPVCLLLGERDPLARLDTLGTIADVIGGPAIFAGSTGHLPWLDNASATAEVLRAYAVTSPPIPAPRSGARSADSAGTPRPPG